jgi:hypothetical protein
MFCRPATFDAKMTFSGELNPSHWSDVTVVITDLANNLVGRTDWDQKVFYSPRLHLLGSDEAVNDNKGKIT